MSETSIPESGTMEIADMYPDEMTVDVSPLPEPELGTGSTLDIWEEERKAQMDAFWDNIHAAEEEHRRREAAKETFNTAGDLFLAEDGDKEAEERLGKDRGMSAFLDPMVMQDKEYRDESIGEVVSQRLGTNPMFLYQTLRNSGLQGEEASEEWNRADYARAVTGMLRRETLGEKAKEEERKRYMQMIEDLPQTIQRVGRGEVSLDDVSPEVWTAMKQAGFSPATLMRAREVYGIWKPKTVGGKVGKFFKQVAAGGAEDYEAMAGTLRGDEVARRLFLNLVAQDGQQDERERRANPGKEMVKGAQERLTKSIVNAYTGIAREPMLWVREHLGQGSGGDKYWLSDEEKEWYAREITEGNAMRADVEKAWEGGVAMAAEENPNIALDIERGVLGLADFALQFRNKKMMIGGIPALFNRNIREEAAGYRPHPVDEEEYNSKYAYIKQLLGKNGTEEEAKRLTDIWKVQTEGDSGKWESIVRGDMKGATEALVFLAGMGLIKKGMMMIPGLGSGVRRAAANWGSSYVGAFVQNTFNTGLAMGVVLPVGTAAAHYAVDSFLDPKMQKVSLGAEELQATLAAMRDGRYWLTNGAVALIGGAVSAPATMRYNRSMLAGAGVAKMLGVSEKQFYGEVAGKPGYTWRDKIFGLAGKNANEREGQDARKRAQEYIKTYGKVAEKWVRKEIAIEAALEELGVSFEKGKDGKVYMLTGGTVDKDGKYTKGQVRTEMTEDEADAYVVGVMGAKLNRMAAVMKNEAGKTRLLEAYKKYVKGEQDIVWLLNPERMEELVEKGKRASERLKQRMEEERGKEVKEGETKKEVDEREVGKEVHGDIDKDRSLNEVIREGESAAKRLEIARASGEEAEVTRANVTRYKNAAGKTIKRVLRIVNGASVREMSEELSEAVTQDFMEDNGVNDAQGYMMLRRLADFMRQSNDPDIKAAADAIDTLSKTHPEVAEKIMADGFDSQFMGGLSDAEVETVHQALTEGLSRMTELLMSGRGKRPDVEMPDWVDDLMNTRMTNELELQRELGMARAVEQAAKEGFLDETAQRLFGVGKEAIENALRREEPPTKEEMHRGLEDYFRRQDELYARYGRSEDPILTDREYEAAKMLQEEDAKKREEQQAAEEEGKAKALEEHIKEEKEAHPEKTEEQIIKETAEKENETKRERIEADPAAEEDKAFAGGKCVRVEDPQNGNLVCKLGLVMLEDLKILPQFKFGADEKTGEVNPLTAPRFLPDADPIRVWRRKNGEMYIASGRHRAALARRTGVDKIMAFVYDEDDVHTEKWARRFDIELNIRDNQATVLECALFARGYFSEDGQPLSNEQVRVLGMDRKGSIGAIGLMIGREAGEDVMSAFRSGDISEQAAHAIVKFAPLSVPGNEKVQQAGLKELLELGTNHIDEARIAMTVERGKNQMRAESIGASQTNLFGETIDSEEWTKFIKDYIKEKLAYQRAFVRFLSDIGTKKTSAAVRKRFESHLKSSDPQEIKKQLREERQILEMWRNPFEHPELRQEMTDAWNKHVQEKRGGGEQPVDTSVTYSVGREYRVEDDRVGLNERLGERAEYVDIDYDKDFAREMEEYAKEHGIEGMNEKAYVRALVGEAVQNLAAKYPEGMAIGGGKYTLMFPAGRRKATGVAGRRPSRVKGQIVGKLEDLIRKGIHIKTEEPDLRDAGKNKKKNFKWVRSVESFGCPLRMNGEEMLFWFNGTTKNEDPQKVTLYEYGVTETEKENAAAALAPIVDPHSQSAISEGSIGEFLSRVKDKNVVDVKKVGDGDVSVTYSVAGERSALWGANIERAFRDPRDGKMKYVIPLDGVRLKDSVTPGMLNVPVGGHKDVALRDLLEYEGLYEAYPMLRDMRVRLYSEGGEGMRGLFRHRKGQAAYILLNVGKREGLSGEELRGKFLRTLLHEAQHAIQRYEGWGFGWAPAKKHDTLSLLDAAIEQREAMMEKEEYKGSEWQRANLEYLEELKRRVEGMKEGDAEWGKLSADVAWYTSGEQESRWVQYGQEGELVPENAETITRAYAAADLGGVTFAGLPNDVDRGLVPQGDFLVDRRVFQMKEAVARRMEALRKLMYGWKPDRAVELAKEAGDIVREVERLLPPSYGFALEPYKIFFDSYAMLRGSGEAERAGELVPMKDWSQKMRTSYERVAVMLASGDVRRDLKPFLEGLEGKDREYLEGVWERWAETEKEVREEMRENGERARRAEVRQKVWERMREREERGFVERLMQMQGKMRMDKLMAAFLKRVSMQLTAYRKDRVLGKIRSAIDALTPMPGKDGKPVKGRMNADDYKKLTDLVRLMEMTKGERDRFEQEHFVDDKGVAVWDDKPIDEKVAVTTYDNEGKEVTLEVTKGEFDTYACFDGMTAEQAERMAGALGEFIRTGRQAWDNAELAQRQKIAGWCRAAIDAYGETAGEKKARRQKEQRAMGALKKKFLAMTDAAMNDAQFFDAISSVPEMRGWTQDAVQRIANAHSYMEWQEKLRNEWLLEKAKEIFGTEDIGEITRLEDELRREEDTSIVLRQQAPNFEEQESGQLRKMFVNLLLRKTKTKNFNPNRMAAALKYLRESEAEIVPENVLREVEDKFGSLGDAAEYNGEPVEAWNALLTETERGRFEGMRERAKERAEKARAKWEEKRNVKAAEDLERGGTESTEIARRESEETLKLSRAQAAYRVLLCEQEDYAETLAQQGYTPEVVDRLREFAGEKMMAWAYALREKMGERTEEIANVYEKLYGMPFPKVENYFRAFFDVGYDVTQQAVLDDSGTGAAARGGSIKILRTRHHRVAPIDPTMSAFEAFQIGMKEQDVLLGYGELPRDLASILNYKQTIQYGEHQTRVAMQDVLENAYGSPVVVTMRGHVDNMVRLMREVGRFGVANMRLMQGLSRASAQGILNFRAGTLAKQFTAVFNAVSGAEDIEFFRDYMPSLMKVMMGLGRISPGELGKRPELAGRFKGWDTGAHGRSLFGATDARTAVGKTAIKAQRGMALMERLDVWCNQVSSAALYDAYYRRAQLANKELSREELDGMAMEQVRRALALKSQPLDWRQTSFAATKPTFLTTAMFFLGGETFNTFGRAVSLAAKGEYKDAAALWLAQGAALQVMQAMFDFVTDDEEQRKRRTLGGYVFNVFAGPASGIPFLSTGLEKARNWAVRTDFGKRVKANSWLPHIQESSLLPTMDIEKVYRELKKAERTGDWESYALAVTDAMRETAILAAMATYNKTGSVALRVKAGALIVGAATNIADFLIRAERAQRQRWGWWGGKK